MVITQTKTICFYTYEFFPFTSGGCGTYIRQTVDILSLKYKIIILIYNTKSITNKIDRFYKYNPNVLVFRVQDLVSPKLKSFNIYKQRSWEFFQALKKLTTLHQIDIVELFEYVGIGYYTLKRRQFLLKNIKYITRAHGPMKIIDYFENDFKYNLSRKIMYQMEKYSLKNADIRIFPSKEIIKDYSYFYHHNFYKLSNKILPPYTGYIKKNSLSCHKPKFFLYYSNLKRIKSPETFINAAIIFLRNNPKSKYSFIVAGGDSLYKKNFTYKDRLTSMIPDDLQPRFIFTGKINHTELNRYLRQTKAAVITSKWESFSLVFYEIYNKNIPVIVRNISCFSNYHFLSKYSTQDELFSLLCEQTTTSPARNEIIKLNNSKKYYLSFYGQV